MTELCLHVMRLNLEIYFLGVEHSFEKVFFKLGATLGCKLYILGLPSSCAPAVHSIGAECVGEVIYTRDVLKNSWKNSWKLSEVSKSGKPLEKGGHGDSV